MTISNLGGYMGSILRVDLSIGEISEEPLNADVLRRYIGGIGLGAKYLYDEVQSGVDWWAPENRLMFLVGPVTGAGGICGAGGFCVVTKGALTEFSGTSQAQGFFGAFLKQSGFDGIIVQGAVEKWCYLHVHDGTAELHDASHIMGKDVWEVDDIVKQEVGKQCSVLAIGPAGENRVRFAGIISDRRHAACRNGVGAVMGSKRLKAIVVERGERRVPVKDAARLKQVASRLFKNTLEHPEYISRTVYNWGTSGVYRSAALSRSLPVKNLTTAFWPEYEGFTGEYIRTHFPTKRASCWGCRMGDTRSIQIPEGPYKGSIGYEPQFSQIVAMSSLTGQRDPAAAVMLSNLTNRLGLECDECGWLLAWVMECYERGLLIRKDLNGLDMSWGNVETMEAMLWKIALRQGVGDTLAEGVKRAAERVGGDALDCAVYASHGATFRMHDYRASWRGLLDTCLSGTGTCEIGSGSFTAPDELGLPQMKNPFDPEEVSTMNAKLNGKRLFEDSLPICLFCVYDFQLTVDMLNAITGWDFTIPEAMQVGRRVSNQLRLFNLRHGMTKEMEAPSARMFLAPPDGPSKGLSSMPHWGFMRRNYYQHMGWDPDTGKPLPQTLEGLGLAHLIPDLQQLGYIQAQGGLA